MSKCLNCGKTTPINSRTYKHKKYCDRKCTSAYYNKTKRYSENPRWDWGTRTAKSKKKVEDKLKAAEAKLARLRETMVDRQEILDHFGMKNPVSIRNFVMKLGIESVSVKLNQETPKYVFYSKEDAKLLMDTIQEKWGHKLKEIPEGYIHTNEVSKILNVTRVKLELFNDKVEVVEKAGWFINKQEVIDYVQKRDERKTKAKERRELKEQELAERERLRREREEQRLIEEQRKKEEWDKEHLRQKSKRNKLKQEGWIEFGEAYNLGLPKDVNKYVRNDKVRHIDFTHGLSRLYNKEDVLQVASYLEKISIESTKRDGIKVILKDKSDLFPYETRLFNLKIPKWKGDKKRLKSIKVNEFYRDQHFNYNKIIEFKCTKCEETKPYHEFRYSNSGKGRATHCKTCENKRYKENRETCLIAQKERWKRPDVKMRAIVAGQIQKDISFVIGRYFEVQTSTIWEEIQKQCGYNEHDLVKHIENQFGPKMSWSNHARSTQGFRWEVDHVVSRSQLRYDSLSHPNFKKCWSLDNLRPIDAKENKSRWFADKQS